MHSLLIIAGVLAPAILAAPQWGTSKQPSCADQPYPYNLQCQTSAPKVPTKQPQAAPERPNPWSQQSPPAQAQPYPYNQQQPPQAVPGGLSTGSLKGPGGSFVQNDGSGLTLHSGLGTYHKGPDGTYVEGLLGAYGTAPDGTSVAKGGLGTVINGPDGITYKPKGFGSSRGN